MKRVVMFAVAIVAVVGLTGVAFAQMGWGGGYGPGYGHMGWGRGGWGMGPGMMGGGGGCPGMAAWGAGAASATPVTKDQAQEIVQAYAKENLPGFTIERMLPFERRFGTMYQAELKGPKGETRLLHVNPWGRVMPFGGPVTQ